MKTCIISRFLCIFFLVSVATMASQRVYAQDFNYRVNALYIYNFAKYVDWKEATSEESITIGIIGNSPVFDQLKSIINNKKVYGKDIFVRKITTKEATQCNMLVISKDQIGVTQSVCEMVKNQQILVITEKQGYTKRGAQICIYVDDEDNFKTKFELSKTNVSKSRLKISQELISLGEIVN